MIDEETHVEPELQKLEEVQEDWKNKYLLTLAEMENMRKRMQKERHETTRFGIENAIAEFLPAIDNFGNALRFAEGANPEVKNWALGFEMLLAQFKEVLHNHGVTSFHSEGNLFDPECHEAIEIEETEEHPDGMILQEFSKGYKSAGRILRPARVKVAKYPKPLDEEKENLEQQEEGNYEEQ